MILLIAFLGNYGKEYEQTRHNAAWIFGDSLPFADKLIWKRKFKGKYATVDMETFRDWAALYNLALTKDSKPVQLSKNIPEKIYFLRPETYMNLSGESIIEVAHFFKIKPEEILVIHDELELTCGTIGLKYGGGLGGHNGLRSTQTCLGTPNFWRLRFGIDRPEHGSVADYVLHKFTDNQNIILAQVFPQAAVLLSRVILSSNPEKLLPQWSKKKLSA